MCPVITVICDMYFDMYMSYVYVMCDMYMYEK